MGCHNHEYEDYYRLNPDKYGRDEYTKGVTKRERKKFLAKIGAKIVDEFCGIQERVTSDSSPRRQYVRPPNQNSERPDDKLARLLCSLCTVLEDSGHHDIISRNPELDVWWVAHKEYDENRERNAALAKLSDRERELLGF